MFDSAFFMGLVFAGVMVFGAWLSKPGPVFLRKKTLKPEEIGFFDRQVMNLADKRVREADRNLASVPAFMAVLKESQEKLAKAPAKSRSGFVKQNPAGLMNRAERRKLKLKIKA